MKSKKFKLLLLIIIVVLAAVLRLYKLEQFPNGFTGDEVQQGYSGYSILKTGHDEWGQLLPLFPRGFGDYKPPLYTYLTVPSEAIFGLNIFSIRLPAAIFGILSVLAVFFLAKELTNSEAVGLWSAGLLAISPWAIQISRTAFEGGLGILTFPLGLLFFLKSKKKPSYLIYSAVFFGLTLYTYHAWRLFVALFIIGLVLINWKMIVRFKNLIPAVVLLIFILPLFLNLNATVTRSSDVGITSSQSLQSFFNNKISSPLPPIIDKAINNKFFYIGDQFLQNYLSYFSPGFFFTGNRSDGTYLNFPYFALVYWVEIIFWVFAALVLLKNKNKESGIVLLWLLLAAIPVSLAVGGGNANRAPTFLPLVEIISAIGLVEMVGWLHKKAKLKTWQIQIGVGPLLILSLLTFIYFYLVQLPQKPPDNLRYGYTEVFKKAVSLSPNYSQVIFSKVFTEPQIFVAFYSKMDPRVFQSASKDWLRYQTAGKLYVDQLQSWNLGKYYFEDLNFQKDEGLRKNVLVISKPEDFPADTPTISEVQNPQCQVIYKMVPTSR